MMIIFADLLASTHSYSRHGSYGLEFCFQVSDQYIWSRLSYLQKRGQTFLVIYFDCDIALTAYIETEREHVFEKQTKSPSMCDAGTQPF